MFHHNYGKKSEWHDVDSNTYRDSVWGMDLDNIYFCLHLLQV